MRIHLTNGLIVRIRRAFVTWINWVPIHHDLGHKKNLADVFAVLDEVMGIGCFIEFEALHNLRLDDALSIDRVFARPSRGCGLSRPKGGPN